MRRKIPTRQTSRLVHPTRSISFGKRRKVLSTMTAVALVGPTLVSLELASMAPITEAMRTGNSTASVIGPALMIDANGIAQMVVAQRLRISVPSAPEQAARPVVFTQAGLLPAQVLQRFEQQGWRVEQLPADVTDQRLIREVQTGLEEWAGPMLIVVGNELESAVKQLPAYSRVTAVLLNRDLARSLTPALLFSYLADALRNFPGRFLQLDTVVRTGLEEAVVVSTYL